MKKPTIPSRNTSILLITNYAFIKEYKKSQNDYSTLVKPIKYKNDRKDLQAQPSEKE